AGDEAAGQALGGHLVPARRGAGLGPRLAPDVRGEAVGELHVIADHVAASAVARVDRLAPHRERRDLVLDTVGGAEVVDELPVGRGVGAGRGGGRTGGGLSDLAAGGDDVLGVLRVHDQRRVEGGVVHEGRDVAPALAAVGREADAAARVLLVDDLAVGGVDEREDAVAAVDLVLLAGLGIDADLAVVLQAGVDDAVLGPGDAVGQERVEPGLGAEAEALHREVVGQARADVLAVVAAVVAGQEGHAALAVGNEDAGVLIGGGRRLARVGLLQVRAGGGGDHE